MTETPTLEQILTEELGRRAIEGTPIPQWLLTGLSPSFEVRPYQVRAFQYAINYWEEDFRGKPAQNHQLLFHMATGSGKTMIMAGLILYFYNRGYRNFLFFVNSKNVLDKTRHNFLNPKSAKYLFATPIAYAGKVIQIREAENFQGTSNDDVAIVFSTIQGLHGSLSEPRENALTYEDFAQGPIVLISDEAHHINAETKRGRQVRGATDEVQSWEGTVERIFRSNTQNVLLEFTATVDFSDDHLASKYKPKLVFDYPLKEFRKDGYSKEVKVLQADLGPFDRALQAVLLSQHRRKVFEKHKQRIKPVILFKARTIKQSQEFLEEFETKMAKLKASDLAKVRRYARDYPMKGVFSYLAENNITLANLASELREEFAPARLVSVNTKEESEIKQIAVNTLEDPENEYRAVFAVDKLNEGWDVLNLFDIVRLYDTRDSKAGKVGKTTMSEAQLIGRGARYCPFRLFPDQLADKRKYDADLRNDLRICEEFYYHSAYNPRYVQELNTALQDIGLKPKASRERPLALKNTFRRSSLYEDGYLYANKREPAASTSDGVLVRGIRERTYKIPLHTGHTTATSAFGGKEAEEMVDLAVREYRLIDLSVPVVRKAISRNSFYEFRNLKRHFRRLQSVTEFITSPDYLREIRLEVSGLRDQIDLPTPEDKIDAATKVLEALAALIEVKADEYRGTHVFEARPIKEVFSDRLLTYSQEDGGDRECGRSMSDPVETSYHLDLRNRDWYVFNDCFGTSEEKLLVQFVARKYTQLKKKYSDVYFIRNEKFFQLFNFSDGKALEPDFVLYLIAKDASHSVHYQVFIEPKGSHLIPADAWKEEFLLALRQSGKLQPLLVGPKYVLWGMPFFNESERQAEFEGAFSELEGVTSS